MQRVLTVILSLILLAAINPVFAQTCAQWAAKLESLEGEASVKRSGADDWQATATGDTYCYGDTLRVNQLRAALRLENETLVRLNEGSTIRFMPPEKSFWAELISGAAHFISRTPKDFTIKAPYVNAAVEGTEFLVTHSEAQDTVSVFEGTVLASNEFGSTRLQSMQQSTALPGAAPSAAVTIRLRDTADWTLHYPPFFIDPADLPGDLKQASAQDILTQLGQPSFANSAQSQNTRAAIALAFGYSNTAKASNQRALELEPENADARALKSLILLIDGDKTQALNQSSSLVAQHKDNTNAWIVHSYNLQAAFLIAQAQQAAQQALSLAPKNPLAIIRAAELAISQDQNTKAKKLLARSTIAHPFYKPYSDGLRALIALQNNNNRKAHRLLLASIKENPNIPQTRFLLGLSEIRLNQLQKGRENLEMAVALAPGNSLYRSYLGKAYATEKRGDKATEQFKLAKILDPNDPTPWFYSALEKQSNNDFVGAIKSYEVSRKLNDGRAVYRSRMLLDQDNSARGASQGLVYSAVGFADQAVSTGTESVRLAPTDHAGHRLLAESYGKAPYYEALTASERLQANAHQPLGVRPLPLGLGATGLQVVEGTSPASLGINEYTPLFLQEGLDAQLTLLGGSHDTQAYDANASFLRESVALTLSRYYYKSVGFRDNNDAEYAISNGLLQWQPLDSVNLQVEVSKREDEFGDLGLRFDPETYSDVRRESKDSDTYRLIGTFKVNASNKILLSATQRNSVDTFYDYFPSQYDFLPGYEANDMYDTEVSNTDIQYFINNSLGNILLGYTGTETSSEGMSLRAGNEDDPKAIQNRDFKTFYTYFNTQFLNERIQIEGGAEYLDLYSETNAGALGPTNNMMEITDSTEIFPKLGITIQPYKYASLRIASFKTAQRENALETTLLPTHIAGFSQVFDFEPSITSDNKAVAIDTANLKNFSAGLSFSDQDIDQEILVFTSVLNILEREINHTRKSAYVSYLFGDKTSLSLSHNSDDISRPILDLFPDQVLPLSIKTQETRLQVNHQFTSWLTGQAQLDRVAQEYMKNEVFRVSTYDESFFTLNGSLLVKLPKKIGTIKLEAKNLENKKYYYADFNVFTSTPRVQSNMPERSIYMILQFNLP